MTDVLFSHVAGVSVIHCAREVAWHVQDAKSSGELTVTFLCVRAECTSDATRAIDAPALLRFLARV